MESRFAEPGPTGWTRRKSSGGVDGLTLVERTSADRRQHQSLGGQDLVEGHFSSAARSLVGCAVNSQVFGGGRMLSRECLGRPNLQRRLPAGNRLPEVAA